MTCTGADFTDKKRLTEEIIPYVGTGRRLEHVLSTESECEKLAKIFALDDRDTKRLCTAAMFHDITKNLSYAEQIDLMRAMGLTFPHDNLIGEKTMHAVSGANLAKRKFPESVDDVVYEAILWHTTGKADMTLIQKLLYLADYIEETRTFEDCVKLRRFFYSKIGSGNDIAVLNETLILSFDMTISDLLKSRLPIHKDTVSARNYLLEAEARK